MGLKVLLYDLAQDAGRMRRFPQEAQVASPLKHPNVAYVYEIGELDSPEAVSRVRNLANGRPGTHYECRYQGTFTIDMRWFPLSSRRAVKSSPRWLCKNR